MTEVKELKVEDIRAEAEKNIKCPVKKSLYYVTGFLEGPMCGRCFPCEMGSYELRIRLENIVNADNSSEKDLAVIKRIAADMLEASMCKKGKDTAKFISDWMDTEIFKEHIAGKCRTGECHKFIEYRIIPQKCTMCGLCLEACKDDAIMGEKAKPYRSGYQPFEIRQKRCTKCDACLKVCPVGAIVIVEAEKQIPTGV